MSKKAYYEQRTSELILPILDELGFSLYDIEYVKEAGENYLRVYIDKPGGITIDDCVATSRRMNDVLDREDYIPDAYTFEVSSPGVCRRLRKEEHFADAIGLLVQIGLFAKKNGQKEVCGILRGYKDGNILIESEGQDITISKEEAAYCRLAFQ